jgi:hypothetical protein
VCGLATDSRVLARKRVRAKAWQLGSALGWARQVARRQGFADVSVGCEPTGHRWRVLDQLAAELGMPLVCVQPLLVGRARESEDYTRGGCRTNRSGCARKASSSTVARLSRTASAVP